MNAAYQLHHLAVFSKSGLKIHETKKQMLLLLYSVTSPKLTENHS